MKIQTVRGDISPNEVGFSLLHEHIYADFWNNYYSNKAEGEYAQYGQSITMDKLGILKRNAGALMENLLLTDVDLTIREVKHFKNAGGSLIMDATTVGASPSREVQLMVSEETGIHIVAATGYYLESTIPPQVAIKSISELADGMISDIHEGFANANYKAGFIGEIGAVGEKTPLETKIITAVAIAQKETGAGVTLHTACANTFFDSSLTDSWGKRTQYILDMLEKNGADLSKIIVGHVDSNVITTMDERMDVLKRGAVIQYDNFGQECPYDRENSYALNDWQRVMQIAELIAMGYTNQIVLSSDVWTRLQYIEYGGWGYAHCINNICPMLLKNGVTPEQLETITVLTPRRLLSLV